MDAKEELQSLGLDITTKAVCNLTGIKLRCQKEIKKELDIKKRWYLFWTQTHRIGLLQNQKTPITM